MTTAIYSILAFLFGASIGSFINLVADRLPKGKSLISPPSHCPNCGRRLTPLELIPVLSYLILRGKCYQCHEKIPLRILVVETVFGVMAILVWGAFGISLLSLALFGFLTLFTLLGIIDLEWGIIPDLIVYPGLVLGLLLSPWWRLLGLERDFLGATRPWEIFLGSILGAIVLAGFFSLVILLSRGGMGWGDAKMGALIGLITGLPGAIVAILVSIMSGGIIASLLLALGIRRRGQTIPFGPFLTFGAILSVLWGGNIWRWYWALFNR